MIWDALAARWRRWRWKQSSVPARWRHLADAPSRGGVFGHVASTMAEEVVVVDCETSEFDKHRGELLSIAAVVIRGNCLQLSQALDLTICSSATTHPDAVRVHFLRHEDRRDGVSSAEAIERFLDFVGSRPIVGFYIEFDRAILNRYIEALYGFSLPNRFIEVSEIYRRQKQRLHPELQPDMTFEGLARDLDIPVIDRHTALGDAVTTGLMYLRLIRSA